jgi:DNA-directed RNA polymerase subunit RPC12/RpoP
MMDALTRRMDQVEADVECLMCGRRIGQLFGVVWRGQSDPRTPRTVANLTLYRETDPVAQIRPVQQHERFRCNQCGGQGFVNEVSVWELPDKLADDLCPIHIERTVRRGRKAAGCRCMIEVSAA